jgi:hypothetical protein
MHGLNILYINTHTRTSTECSSSNKWEYTALFKLKKTYTFTAYNRTSHYLVMQAGQPGALDFQLGEYIRIKYSITYMLYTRAGKCLVDLANSVSGIQHLIYYDTTHNIEE